MPRLHALLFCSLLVPACDSSATPTTAKSEDKSAAAPVKKDDATLIAEAKTAAMSGCSLPPPDFTDAKMKTSEALVGSVLHVWTGSGPTPREYRQFVAKKAMVRSVNGKELEIYVTSDDVDPCSLPKSNKTNMVTGPVVMSKDGNEVVAVSIGDSKPGKYFGRTMEEGMQDPMGGPPNWLGVHYTVKDAKVSTYAGDANFPYATINPDGRSHLELTKFEMGKKLEAKIHACMGGDAFLIGPIDAGFCPDAQSTP